MTNENLWFLRRAWAEEEKARAKMAKPTVTHLCFACGWPMEETGEYHEFEIDLMPVEEPIYRCVNPDCNEDD